MSELNPNHPVTAGICGHWHKVVALLLLKLEDRHAVITPAEVERMAEQLPDCAVALEEKADGIHVWVVERDEAERLARKEGGLPT